MHSMFRVVVIAAALLAPAQAVLAQAFPGKVVRIVIPFSLGGSNDLTARVLLPHLMERWKSQVIVDPRIGAASTIGADHVAKSPPDGNTILFTSTQYAYAPITFAKLPYDPLNDLMPVTLVTTSPQIIVAHPSLPVKTPKDLVAFARARPNQLTIGTPGNTLPTLSFLSLARVKMEPVPYKGAGPLNIAVMGGHVTLGIGAISSWLGNIKSGRVKPIGVCSLKPSALYPDAPPMADAVPGFEAVAWFGMFVPRGTPPAVVRKIRDDIADILKDPAVIKGMHGIGGEPSGMATEEYAKFVRSEIEKWGKVAKAAGIQPQ